MTAGAPGPTASTGEPVREQSTTHLGAVFDELVAVARRRQRPEGTDVDYDTIRRHLDPFHYLLQAPWLLGNQTIEPVRHYLRQGAKAQLNPEINFSTIAYLDRHPERAQHDSHPYLAWLREGRAADELSDPALGLEKMAPVLGLTPARLAEFLAEQRSDLQHRLRHGVLGEMFAKAALVEPMIGEAWVETTRPKMTPVPTRLVADQVGAIHACHEAAGHSRARVVVLADAPGSPRATRFLNALVGVVAPPDVLVVYTDQPAEGQIEDPGPVRTVDYAAAVQGLTASQAQPVLVELLRSLHAEAVVGVGSEAFAEVLASYGKALHASERIFLALAGLEPGPFGNRTGTALRLLYRYADVVEGFFADDNTLVGELADTYQLPPADVARLHPVAGSTPAELAAILLTDEAER